MSTIEHPYTAIPPVRAAQATPVRAVATAQVTSAQAAVSDAAPTRRGLAFWVIRYLPAEIAGTAAMVIGGLLATAWTDAAAVVAVCALVGETVGFYLVLAITIFIEQALVAGSKGRAVGRTGMLLVAEFGAAELIDTFIVRPAALMLGIWLLADPLWGMLAGKVAADIVFYAIAAGAFTLTAKTGLRDGRRAHRGDAATPGVTS